MADYAIHLQKTLKRNYFQSFHHQQVTKPFKIARYEQPSSSHIDIEENHPHHLPTPIDRISLPTPMISNFLPVERDQSVIPPVQLDLILIDHQQRTSTDSITNPFISVIEERKVNQNPSVIILKEQKLEPIENDEPIFSPWTSSYSSRKRIISEQKSSSSRQRLSKSITKIDEHSVIKPTRMSTRHNTIKTEIITDTPLSFETKPVILSSNEISKAWLTHTVFYRCHACSHKEFFVVSSRECINLHISSHHRNMEENFKQRLSNYLTKKGRSLKLFQHYLKWQQPWSEKQIGQIFKLSNK